MPSRILLYTAVCVVGSWLGNAFLAFAFAIAVLMAYWIITTPTIRRTSNA